MRRPTWTISSGLALCLLLVPALRLLAQPGVTGCFPPPRAITYTDEFKRAMHYEYTHSRDFDANATVPGYFDGAMSQTGFDHGLGGTDEAEARKFVQTELSNNVQAVLAECLHAICEQTQSGQPNAAALQVIGSICTSASNSGAGVPIPQLSLDLRPSALSVVFTDDKPMTVKLRLHSESQVDLELADPVLPPSSLVKVKDTPHKISPQDNKDVKLEIARPPEGDYWHKERIEWPSKQGKVSALLPINVFRDRSATWPSPFVLPIDAMDACGKITANAWATATHIHDEPWAFGAGQFKNVTIRPNGVRQQVDLAYANNVQAAGSQAEASTYVTCNVTSTAVTTLQMNLTLETKSDCYCGQFAARGLGYDAPVVSTVLVLPGDARTTYAVKMDVSSHRFPNVGPCVVSFGSETKSISPEDTKTVSAVSIAAGTLPVSISCSTGTGPGCWPPEGVRQRIFNGLMDISLTAKRNPIQAAH